MSDRSYADTPAKHRGQFLEDSITRLTRQAFGADHVFANAIIRRSGGEIAAEADVLVIYGEFTLVIQAKSKRLTIVARSGNTEEIKSDFRPAIQLAYEQAVRFIELMIEGKECELGPGDRRSFKWLSRVFPVVVLSDHFPSLAILSRRLIHQSEKWAPVIVDLFFLDVLFEVLSHPCDTLYYLQQRGRFFDRIATDSEFNLLGFHLKHKLYVGDDVDFMLVDRDFGAEVNEHFAAKEAGVRSSIQFVPLEERVNVPEIGALISALKAGPPEVAGAALELLDFSEEALRNIAETIGMVRGEVLEGKSFKAFSVETFYGGISYVAVRALNERAVRMAEMIARKHKYKQKKDRWYILLDHVYSSRVVDGISVILQEWEDSDELREFVEDIGPLLKETHISFRAPSSDEEDT
jgi:hypothetical protein